MYFERIIWKCFEKIIGFVDLGFKIYNLIQSQVTLCVRMCDLVYFRWVEQDPKLILSSVLQCIDKAVNNLKALNINLADICGMC